MGQVIVPSLIARDGGDGSRLPLRKWEYVVTGALNLSANSAQLAAADLLNPAVSLKAVVDKWAGQTGHQVDPDEETDLDDLGDARRVSPTLAMAARTALARWLQAPTLTVPTITVLMNGGEEAIEVSVTLVNGVQTYQLPLTAGWTRLAAASTGSPVTPPAIGRDGKYIRVDGNGDIEVYYDSALGEPNGPALANAVQKNFAPTYATLRDHFCGAEAVRVPFRVYIDSGAFGAYHLGCSSTEIHCAAYSGDDGDLVSMLLAAEVVEVLAAALPIPVWGCKTSAGEGLSRVLAAELYPSAFAGFVTAGVWLNSARPDFVTTVGTTDTDLVAVGCSTLFLNYLHSQPGLEFSWHDIICGDMPIKTLADVYAKLTKEPAANAFPAFDKLVLGRFPLTQPFLVQLTSDNPFPI